MSQVHKRGDDPSPKSDSKAKWEHSRHNPAEFRKLMQAELSHVPSLDARMQKLMDIQAKRYDLQKKRQDIGTEKGPNRDAVVKKFHALLRQDMELAENARGIVHEIVKDMARIKEELDTRRTTLQTDLEQIAKTADDEPSSATKSRDLRRRMRYLDFLEKKLDDLKSHPERLDLLARVLRGIPMDEFPPPPDAKGKHGKKTDDTGDDSVQDLRRKRRQLQKELNQVEYRLNKLTKNKKDETTSATK